MIKSVTAKLLQLDNLYPCDFNREIIPTIKLTHGLINTAIKLEQKSKYHENIIYRL